MLVPTVLALGPAALAPWPEGPEVEFADLQLELTLPALEGLERRETQGRKGHWTGTLGGAEVDIALLLFDAAELRFHEPGDVVEHAVDYYREQAQLDLADSWHHTGEYGAAEFASCALGVLPAEGDDTDVRYMLGGLLEGQGYLIQVDCSPAPDDAGRAVIEAFFDKGVRYDGPVRDPEWTDEEVVERWVRDVPAELHGDFEFAVSKPGTRKKAIVRTEHYLIMGNSSGARGFGKKAEGYYKEIKKVFPFDEVQGRRLMPIFLFRTPDDYFAFYAHIAGVSLESARKSKGHAWRDYYATWYEAPNDPVHIHEMTHQIFKNRLRLSGGGSWFQEGVAEYIETSDNERNNAARLVKKGDHVPLRQFVQLPSLLGSSVEDVRGRGGAGDAYKQAALLIEFLRESKFGKKRFEDFLCVMGKVPRGDEERIEAAFRAVYEVGIDELEAEWREWAEKR